MCFRRLRQCFASALWRHDVSVLVQRFGLVRGKRGFSRVAFWLLRGQRFFFDAAFALLHFNAFLLARLLGFGASSVSSLLQVLAGASSVAESVQLWQNKALHPTANSAIQFVLPPPVWFGAVGGG